MSISNIHIITPIITEGIRSLEDVLPFERDDLKFSHSILENGPSSIESEYDEAISVPDIIRKAVEAEHNGADAIIIDCMGDPGLNACKEAVSIPVIGPCQTSMYIASMLGDQFSFITVLERLRPMIRHLSLAYGVAGNYASFAAVNVPVLDIHKDIKKLNEALIIESINAIENYHSGAIILGCTGFLGCAEAIETGLTAKKLNVPVIDPIPLCVHIAAALIATGLKHSKRVYPFPEKKKRVGYTLPAYTRFS